MFPRPDDRAQSLQVGAVLLFGVLVILLATYQAVVVPNQNRQVEASHVDTISGQMQDLRNAIVSIPGVGAGRSVTLALGTRYPGRIVAVNPQPPTGELRTWGTTVADVNLTVANAVATNRDVDDAWDGTDLTFASGALAFEPGYNEYPNPPTIVYENTVLYHRFPSGNLTRAGQRIVDGRQLTLVTLNGSIDTSASDAVAVDLQAVSASNRRIAVTNEAGESIVLAFASRLDDEHWRSELDEDGQLAPSGHVVSVTDAPIPGSDFREIRVELERGVTYEMRMAKVGVGTGVADEGPAYLVGVGGDRTIQEGSRVDLAVEVRDRLNNPVSGVSVNASVEGGPQHGSLASTTVETDEDGRAVFEYRADEIDGVSQRAVAVNFSYVAQPGADFDETTTENVTVDPTVQNTDGSGLGGAGGGSPTSLGWLDPTTDNADGLSDCSADECTFDVAVHGDADLTLRVETSPTVPGLDVEFGVNNTTVGAVTPSSTETGSGGEATTTFSASANGTVDVVAGSNVGSDVLTLHVTGVGSGGGDNAPDASIDNVTDQSTDCNRNPGGNCQGGSTATTQFVVDYSGTDVDDDLTELQVELIDPDGTVVDSVSNSYGGVSSAAESATLSHEHTEYWSDDYTIRVTATDANGNEDVTTTIETADGT